MSITENKYKLNQDDKEYILSTSEENQSFKMSCQDTKNPNSLIFVKYYPLEEIKKYDIFNSATSIQEAIEQFDKLLGSEKVGIVESNTDLIINIYTSTDDKIEFTLSPDAAQLSNVPSQNVFSSHIEPQEPQMTYSQYKNFPQNEFAQNEIQQNYPANYQEVPDIPQPIFSMANSNQNINQTNFYQNENLNQNFNQNFYQNQQQAPLGLDQFFTPNTISGVVDSNTYNKFIEKFTNGAVVPQNDNYQSLQNSVSISQVTSHHLPTILEKTSQEKSSISFELPNDIKTQVDNYNSYVNQINQNQPQYEQTQYKKVYESNEIINNENNYINQQNEINELKKENEYMKTQLSELNILKKRVAELENYKNQLSELESLRQTVNELNYLKNNYLRNNPNIFHNQNEFRSEKEIIEHKIIPNENNNLIMENSVQQIAVKGDIIRNTVELEMLCRKMYNNSNKICLNLIYKATADSDKAESFHEKCDFANSTLVLIETNQGKRFGGYTTCSWSGDCIDKKDENAFIFSLDKMMTYENIPGEDAIGCYPKFGAIFLGCQIRIYDDAFSKGGTTFEKGLNYNTQEDFELNGGERVFSVKEIEVYEVIQQ